MADPGSWEAGTARSTCASQHTLLACSVVRRETSMNTRVAQMPDENIDCQRRLHQGQGSCTEASCASHPGVEVVPMLATASMLQLDKLIWQCGEIMKEDRPVIRPCAATTTLLRARLQNIRAMCLQWLLDNLTPSTVRSYWREVSLDLMKETHCLFRPLRDGGRDGCVHDAEKWMFLQLQPTWRGPPQRPTV